MKLVKEKIEQAQEILKEQNIDCWLVFVRETPMMADPVLPIVVGHEVTWQSFFLYTKDGRAIALVGNYDRDNFVRSNCFDDVRSYTASPVAEFKKLIKETDPKKIAVNYSESDVASDGLTHGMYLLLLDYLKGTEYADRLVSSEEIVSKLRSRKNQSEIKHLKKAAEIATDVWDDVVKKIKIGMSEKEVGALIDKAIAQRGCTNSFDTLVNAGDKTDPGHGLPTNAKISAGDLVHVDFGVYYENYCSDIQRLLYFKRRNEKKAPLELVDAFDMVNEIITATAKFCKQGVQGYEVDALARQILEDHAYPTYQHALGHQLGRSVHDGGAVLGPKWERYGKTPEIPLEIGNVYTLELELILPGIGCVGLEEDVVISDKGTKFLSKRQMELAIR